MDFVNRNEEQSRIRKIISGKRSGFVVVYGRRRCGKLTLLKRVLNDTDIYFMADQAEGAQQIVLLAQVISSVVPGFDLVTYPGWEDLFTTLNQRISERITLCLDEFPYLVKSSPGLPAVIQKITDK